MRRGAVFAALFLAGCASGTSLVTGTARPATTPQSVRVYLEPPPQYEVIGAVTGEAGANFGAQGNLDDAIAQVRDRAAQMGANGVIIDYQGPPTGNSGLIGVNTGTSVVMVPAGDARDREVRARAIFVP